MTQLNRRNFLQKAGQSALTLIILSELSSALSAKFENEYNLTIEDLKKFAQGLTGCVIAIFIGVRYIVARALMCYCIYGGGSDPVQIPIRD